MPILAGLLQAFFAWLAAFFGKWLAKKAAFGAAAVAVFTAMTIALYAALSVAFNGISAVLPDWPGMETAIWVAVPANLPACIGAIISAKTAIAIYRWNVENLKIMSYIT